MSVFHRTAQSWALAIIAVALAIPSAMAFAQDADTYGTYATESGACDAGPDAMVTLSKGSMTGPGFSCELGQEEPVGSGLVNYAAQCTVDDVALSDPVTFDLGNYADHFEVAVPGRDGWLQIYPCTPVPMLMQ